MIVGVCKLDLHLPGCRSLKEKRRVLRRLKDRTFARFAIPVAEVEHQDLWQRAMIGFAAVGNEHGVIEGILQRMINAIGDLGDAEILDQHVEIMNL